VTTPRAEVDSATSRVLDERRWALDALASLGDGIMIVDSEHRLVYSNPAAARLIGVDQLSRDSSEWSDGYGIFLPDGQTPLPAHELPLLLALEGEVSTDVELFVRNPSMPSGVHVLVNASPLRDERGHVRGAVSIFHDISLRRAQELEVLEGKRQLQAILHNIPDIAWLKDREGRHIAVNPRFAASVGKASEAEVLGLTDFDLFSRERAERYRREDEDVMQTRRHHRVEERFVSAAGDVTWIETIKEAVVGENGEVIGTTGIARDITERKRAEEALRTANDELERRVAARSAELAEVQHNLVRKERLAVLGQLAGGVAHQIRNPLAAIMNATYVLRRHLSPEQHPNVEDALRIIHDEVRHANVIITGLLDFARVRAPDRHPTSVAELVERVLGAEVVPPSVTVVREIAEVPLLDVDADQLHGAFLNLVRNAVEAMPEGGELRVEVRRDEDHVVVAVADTGTGISPQVRGHLFEPLHSTKPLGIGLGLVTARTFVEAHGGRISHVERPVGARFEIRLPVP